MESQARRLEEELRARLMRNIKKMESRKAEVVREMALRARDDPGHGGRELRSSVVVAPAAK